jgi:hypothetical protein
MNHYKSFIAEIEEVTNRYRSIISHKQLFTDIDHFIKTYRNTKLLTDLITELNELIEEMTRDSPTTEEEAYNKLLRKTEDDPLFSKIAHLSHTIKLRVHYETEPIWSAWPHGSWASVCASELIGPFSTKQEMKTAIKQHNRSYLGSSSWQVGVPPPTYII